MKILEEIYQKPKLFITCLSFYFQILPHLMISIVYYYKNENCDIDNKYESLRIKNDNKDATIYIPAIYPHLDNTP